MAATGGGGGGGGSKAKATPVPPPTPSQNRTSLQATVKASPKQKAGSDDDSTISVAPSKKDKDKEKGGSGSATASGSGSGTIKLKKPAPKVSKPGNWRDGSVIDDDKKKGTDTPSTTANSVPASPGPVVNQLDDSARETFATGRPLEDSPDLQQCKHCKKSILKTAAKAHLVACLKAKKEKAQRKKEQKEAREKEKRAQENNDDKDDDGDTRMDDDDDDVKGSGIKTAKKSAGKKVEIEKGKKRKAEGESDKAPKAKKKKEELKVKATKPKGPVDVERQCGVLKDGVPCARSLTCKSHSMGAKRAVPGRSLPYDMLLTAYQKKNQAKQQKAAIDANAPLEDEEAANGPVDSDEELAAIQHGLSNWNPQPVVPPLIHVPIERAYQKQRLWEQLHNATNGFSVNIFRVSGYGAQRLPPDHPSNFDIGDGDADGEPETPAVGLGLGMANVAARRASSFNMAMPAGRRVSVAAPR